MLVGTNDGGIDLMNFPIELTGSIGLCLQRIVDAVPDALLDPAIIAGRDGGALTVVLGQILPGGVRLWCLCRTFVAAASAEGGPIVRRSSLLYSYRVVYRGLQIRPSTGCLERSKDTTDAR